MKALTKIIIITLAIFWQLNIFAQNCNSLSGIVNTYAPVSNISGNVVTIGATSGATAPFAVGDYVVLIQMTGIPPVHTGSNMGNYELRLVSAVSGSNITLDGITRPYSFSTEKVQLVRAPHCPNGTVSATVTAKVWDGTTGGVVALHGGTLTLNADIDATGAGFSEIFPPTNMVTSSLSSGIGSTVGRGFDDLETRGGKGGGGIGGGGGNAGTGSLGVGGGSGGGNANAIGLSSYGLNGGQGIIDGEDGGGGGGGGGVIGGGGGGGGGGNIATNGRNGGGGGGGGVNGGGGGGGGVTSGKYGGGGGGSGGIGNGAQYSAIDSGGGAGGGSYGGGGGGASAITGGDDSFGGGGGGSFTGGGLQGLGAESYPQSAGAGNAKVLVPISDEYHFLNTSNSRIIMGGAGGRSICQDGGIGGGIIIMDYENIVGNNFDIRSNGDSRGLVSYCSQIVNNQHGAGAAGGGGGGQLILNVKAFLSNVNISARGGKGGDGNNNGVYHGGVGGGGGGGGGIWIYGNSNSSNTGSLNVFVLNTNINTSGSYDGVNGGVFGSPTNNPKNGRSTGTGGAGGNGLIIQSPDVPAWPMVSCQISALTASPSACNSSTNTYSLSGSITFTDAPATGTLTVSIGAVTQTFTAPFTSPQAYTLTGLTAAGGTQTVTAVFSADAACTATQTYTAPAACAPVCTASQTHTTPVCNNNNTGGNATDDYFSFSVTGTVTDGSGNYVVKIGAWTSPSIVSGQAVSIVGNGLSGNPSLPANGSSITVRVEDATDSTCFTTFMVSSASCSSCPSPNCGTVTVQKN